MARLSKLTLEAVTILIEEAQQHIPGMACTDKELFHKMNEYLLQHEKICYRTFQRYKAAAMAYGEAEVEAQAMFDPLYQDLHRVLVNNAIEQKERLMALMLEAEGNQWLKYRWIMERKFPDFNLRYQSAKFIKEMEEASEMEKLPITLPVNKVQEPVPSPAQPQGTSQPQQELPPPEQPETYVQPPRPQESYVPPPLQPVTETPEQQAEKRWELQQKIQERQVEKEEMLERIRLKAKRDSGADLYEWEEDNGKPEAIKQMKKKLWEKDQARAREIKQQREREGKEGG